MELTNGIHINDLQAETSGQMILELPDIILG
jgi:hypothetical protein